MRSHLWRIYFVLVPIILFIFVSPLYPQTTKFDLDEFDLFVKNIDRGGFKTSDTDHLFRMFKDRFSQEILTTIDQDLANFVAKTLENSTYLESAKMFFNQFGSVFSEEQQKKIDSYVENQLSRFQDYYKYDEKLSRLFADEKIIETLREQFKKQLRAQYETIKESYKSELKRNFPYAADMVVKSHDSLNSDVELKLAEELKKVKILASTGTKTTMGLGIVVFRKAITRLILKVIGKKIAASIVGQIVSRTIPIIGWALAAYDVVTAEKQLLNIFKDEYSTHFHSEDFQRQVFEQSLLSFEDDAKAIFKSSVDEFISSISIKESNRITGLLVQSKSPDADDYFPQYEKSDRVRNVIDSVVRIYGSDPTWSRFKISEKFEIAQSVGIENENMFLVLLKDHKEKFYRACEQKGNVIRELLSVGEEPLVRYSLEFSEPVTILDKLSYLHDRLGSDLKGKMGFVRFLVDTNAFSKLQTMNLTKESLLPLASNYEPIQQLYENDPKNGSFFFEVAAKDRVLFKQLIALLEQHRIAAIQEKIIKGISNLGFSKTKVILSKISQESLISFFDVENYSALVDKYGEQIVEVYSSGGMRFLNGFERVWLINGGYSKQFENDWIIAKEVLASMDIEPSQISKSSIDLYRNLQWAYDIPLLGSLVRLVVSYIIRGNNALAALMVIFTIVVVIAFILKIYFFFFPKGFTSKHQENISAAPIPEYRAQPEPAVVIVSNPAIPPGKEIRVRNNEVKDDNHNN